MTDASTFFPGQLFQNPDGSFTLDITGHVQARGVDILVSGLTPPSDGRVRWIYQPDGSVIAQQFGGGGGSEAVWELDVDSQSGRHAAIRLDAASSTSSPQASVTATASTPTSTRVATILDDQGNSHFAKVVGPGVPPLNAKSDDYLPAHQLVLSRPAQANLSADSGFSVAGWHTIPFNTVTSDPDGLFNLPGSGTIPNQFTAKLAGWYQVELSIGIQNATGALGDVIVGWNNNFVIARINAANSTDVWLSGCLSFNLAHGNVITPSFWINSGAGFGWTMRAGSSWAIRQIT